ncbi:MAG: hypothetical protein R3B09_03105 [Nannocystaceae bacterium]
MKSWRRWPAPPASARRRRSARRPGQLRADAALGLRDVGGFLAEVDGGLAGRAREDVAPVLRALDAARFPAARGEHVVAIDRPGEGGARWSCSPATASAAR